MEGLKIPIGSPSDSSLITFSAMALVNEYVFGQGEIRLEKSDKIIFKRKILSRAKKF